MIVDNERLSSAAKCSTHYWLRHFKGLVPAEGTSLAAEAGSAAHLSFAYWLKNEEPKKEEFLRLFDEYYEPIVKEQAPEERLSHVNVRTIMEFWFEKNPRRNFQFKLIQAPEKGVRTRFANGVEFFGLLDALVEDDMGVVYPLDHKTTGRISDWWLKKYRLSSQLTGYAWAAQEVLGKEVRSVLVNAVEFCKLPVSKYKCRTHGVSYDVCRGEHFEFGIYEFARTQRDIQDWERVFSILLGKIDFIKTCTHVRDLPTEGRFNNSCTFCGYAEFCRGGRQEKALEQMIERRWAPWEK